MKLVQTGPDQYSIEGFSHKELLETRDALQDFYVKMMTMLFLHRVSQDGIQPDVVIPDAEEVS